MAQTTPLRRSAAFLAACLVVIWVGGSFLTALFKLATRLWFGAWPDTRLYGLVPEGWTPGAAALLQDGLPGRLWAALLGYDVLLCLLALPPLLLVPCLLLLRAEHGGLLPALRRSARPFAPPGPAPTRCPPALHRPGRFAYSTKDR